MTGDKRTATSRDDYETPKWLLERIHGYLRHRVDGMALDPFTNERNSAGAAEFMTVADDGLSQPWVDGTFANPPYGTFLPKFATKAVAENVLGVYLVPARFGSLWFRRLTNGNIVLVLDKRLVFELDGEPVTGKNGKVQSAQFDVALVFSAGGYYPRMRDDMRRYFGEIGTRWVAL